jgi:hypothetical protein
MRPASVCGPAEKGKWDVPKDSLDHKPFTTPHGWKPPTLGEQFRYVSRGAGCSERVGDLSNSKGCVFQRLLAPLQCRQRCGTHTTATATQRLSLWASWAGLLHQASGIKARRKAASDVAPNRLPGWQVARRLSHAAAPACGCGSLVAARFRAPRPWLPCLLACFFSSSDFQFNSPARGQGRLACTDSAAWETMVAGEARRHAAHHWSRCSSCHNRPV